MRGEALGPLHGLPLGIKDLNETAGLRTTFGSPLYADHVPQKDGDFVAGLRAAGAVIAAQTRSEEHTSELQSLLRKSYGVLCVEKKREDERKGANQRNPFYT